jgi:hypothetical protein
MAQQRLPCLKTLLDSPQGEHYVKTGFGNGRISPLGNGNAPVTDQVLQISQER